MRTRLKIRNGSHPHRLYFFVSSGFYRSFFIFLREMPTYQRRCLMSSRRKSIARFNRHNRLVSAKGRPKLFLNTPVGQKLTRDVFIEPMADFLAGKFPEQPDKAP